MQSQSRNWILFFGLFFALMLGHTWLRNKLWPPPPPKPPAERVWAFDKAKPNAQRLLLAEWIGAGAAASAPTGVLGFAAEAAFGHDSIDQFAAALTPKAPPKPVEPEKPPVKADVYTMGGGGFLIDAKMTSQGAAVRQLTLTGFPEADRMGLPVKLADGQPKPLDLIPDGKTPSFAIYHYARSDPEEERPLDTLGQRVWTLIEESKKPEQHSLSFATELRDFGVRLVKTFTLRPHELHLGLTVRIERLADAKEPQPFRYQLAGGRGLPIEGEWYTTIFRNTMVAWIDAKGAIERVLEENRSLAHTSGSARFRRGDRQIQYAAVTIQYFASAIVPADDQPNRNFIEFVRATVEGEPDLRRPFLDDVTVRAIAEPVDPKPGEAVEHKYLLYHGPIKVGQLGTIRGEFAVDPAAIERYDTTLHLNTLTDYGKFGFWTDAIIFFTNLVHWLIGVLRNIVPNIHSRDGICIILVTVIVRALMFPVSRRQAATMARTQEKMAKVQPEMKKIKEKFKGDMMAQQQAMSELYKKHDINPAAGLGGCLMVFLQMPVFLGLYFALQESFDFRLKRFLWAPNLTAPDMLFGWSSWMPGFIADPDSQGGFFYLGPFFNLLPIIAIALMFMQQKMMTPPAMDEQQKMQQSMMKYMMIFFGFMFYKVPAGLSLYFICSTGWGLAERKLLPKKKPDATGGPGVPAKLADKNGVPPRGRTKPKSEEPGKLRAWWEKVLKEASKK